MLLTFTKPFLSPMLSTFHLFPYLILIITLGGGNLNLADKETRAAELLNTWAKPYKER